MRHEMTRDRLSRQDQDIDASVTGEGDRGVLAHARETYVGVPVAQPQPTQLQMVEPVGKHRLAEHQAILFGLRLEPKDAAQQQEWRASRPGLWGTGHGVPGGAEAVPSREAA